VRQAPQAELRWRRPPDATLPTLPRMRVSPRPSHSTAARGRALRALPFVTLARDLTDAERHDLLMRCEADVPAGSRALCQARTSYTGGSVRIPAYPLALRRSLAHAFLAWCRRRGIDLSRPAFTDARAGTGKKVAQAGSSAQPCFSDKHALSCGADSSTRAQRGGSMPEVGDGGEAEDAATRL
jgi:hypothetical protein